MKSSSKASKYQSGNMILKTTEEMGALVLGDCNSAMDKRIHKEFNIQTVISIGQQAMPMKEKLPEGCKHYFYDIHDNKSQKVPSQLFDEVSKIIEEGRKLAGVLVHCYAGVSRSSTFVIAYIMQKFNKSYDTAKEEVKHARSCIYPNDGFVHHLKSYEKVLHKREEERLRLLEEQRRLEKEQSLVKSSRRCVRGGVRSADQSPQRVKQMAEESKRHAYEIIVQPIDVIKEQKQQNVEKEVNRANEVLGSPINSILQKTKFEKSRFSPKSAFSQKSKTNFEKKKEDFKLPKVNKGTNQESKSINLQIKKQALQKSITIKQNQQKKPLYEFLKTSRISKQSSSFQKPQSKIIRDSFESKKEPSTQQQSRSVLRESKSVMSTTKYKTTYFEIDESLLNEHEKKVKKIYENKVVVK